MESQSQAVMIWDGESYYLKDADGSLRPVRLQRGEPPKPKRPEVAVAATGHITPSSSTITITKDEYIDSLRKQRFALQKNNRELEDLLEAKSEELREAKKKIAYKTSRAIIWAERNRKKNSMNRLLLQALNQINQYSRESKEAVESLCGMIDEEGANFEKEENYRTAMDKMMEIYGKINSIKGRSAFDEEDIEGFLE